MTAGWDGPGWGSLVLTGANCKPQKSFRRRSQSSAGSGQRAAPPRDPHSSSPTGNGQKKSPHPAELRGQPRPAGLPAEEASVILREALRKDGTRGGGFWGAGAARSPTAPGALERCRCSRRAVPVPAPPARAPRVQSHAARGDLRPPTPCARSPGGRGSEGHFSMHSSHGPLSPRLLPCWGQGSGCRSQGWLRHVGLGPLPTNSSPLPCSQPPCPEPTGLNR